jgi:thiol-disulfide isomerase/thioredoxin
VSLFEDQAVRTVLAVTLLIACLGLTGCSLFGKKKSAATAAPRPFTGSEPAAPRETAAAEPGAPPPGANGLLAGQVVDRFNRRQSKVFIQVVDLEEAAPAPAKLEVETKEDGYFTIPGLRLGRHYKLIARVKDGDRLLSGVTWATPPNPRLSILVSEENTSPGTPPVPEPPAVPDKKGGRGGGAAADKTPAASLDAPIKVPPGPDAPKPGETGATSTGGTGAGTPPNLSNVANGFARAPSPPKVDLGDQYQSPPYRLPPPPSPTWSAVTEERSPDSSALPPGPAPPAHPPNGRAPVPSCSLVGHRLDNFALHDLEGNAWEYRHDHNGRLVLLDFWSSTCLPCRMAIPRLRDLQAKFGRYGLQVIGIAYETGTFAQQVTNVREVRSRYSINYPTLLGGGDGKPCPVRTQFQVDRFPTLILLDESGKIIWRSPSDGLDDNAERYLESLLWQRLVGPAPR